MICRCPTPLPLAATTVAANAMHTYTHHYSDRQFGYGQSDVSFRLFICTFSMYFIYEFTLQLCPSCMSYSFGHFFFCFFFYTLVHHNANVFAGLYIRMNFGFSSDKCLCSVFYSCSFRLSQNQIVQHNPKSGVIASSSDLALQSVHIHQAGNYTCIASNVEGDGESNTLELKVMCT